MLSLGCFHLCHAKDFYHGEAFKNMSSPGSPFVAGLKLPSPCHKCTPIKENEGGFWNGARQMCALGEMPFPFLSLFLYAKPSLFLAHLFLPSPLHFGPAAARDIGIMEEAFLIQRCFLSILMVGGIITAIRFLVVQHVMFPPRSMTKQSYMF